MNIFCSHKLSKLLNLEKTINPEFGVTSSWNAHQFSVAGKKWIIFVHKQTLFSIILIDVVKKDLQNIAFLFTEALITQLEREKLLTPNFESYLREFDQIANFYTTDNDRRTMGSLNDFIYHTKSCYEDEKRIEKARNYAWKYLNEMPSKVLKFNSPRETMREFIKNYG